MRHELLKEAFEKKKTLKRKLKVYREKTAEKRAADVPEGLYEQCPSCKTNFIAEDIVKNLLVCPKCEHHIRVRAHDRMAMTLDEGSFIEKGLGYITLNPLFQDGYEQKLEKSKKTTGSDEAYMYGYGEIKGFPVVIGVLDSYFMMGSMGSVVGEKVVKSIEYALVKRLPLVMFIASGGARMQEGIYSLMQMAKTSAAVEKLAGQGLLFLSVLTHPTTGGVSASFASLGDVILAEQGALIGFAGPRVIKQTIKQSLPEGFQTAEFLKEKGMVDKVVHRHELKGTLEKLLRMHSGGRKR